MIIVAADCTGHGVPGAFVSMLGISLLNELFAKFENQTTAEILEDLRFNVKKLLSQSEQNNTTQDGMDLAICIIDKQLNTLQFSGANNPIILIKNNELSALKPTKNPIGIYPKERPFETTEIKIEKGNTIYMFSDGFLDQFGGEKGDKYKMPRFKDFLLSIHKVPMNEQYTLLKNEFEAWHENREQIDDVMVLGIRF
jgi:serine phosphatase RsbU (regulator of sigma subunit)